MCYSIPMSNAVHHAFGWLKAKRTSKSAIGYLIHMTGWFTCLWLTWYWGRAWLHLLDTFEAAATAYKWSDWQGLYWLEALIEVPIHIFSEPLYCLQVAAICMIFAFLVNKDGYYFSADAAVSGQSRKNGFGLAAIIMFFRR